MADIEKAKATQLANIETKTGKSLKDLVRTIASSGKQKHGEIRDWIKKTYSLGHGDANALAHHALAATSEPPAGGDVLGEIYSGEKAHLRPIHTKLVKAIEAFGAFEVAPKKGYVALRRKKQFAMLGPKTKERFELGINLKDVVSHRRVTGVPPGGMCQYVAALTDPKDVDAALIALIKRAYDAAG